MLSRDSLVKLLTGIIAVTELTETVIYDPLLYYFLSIVIISKFSFSTSCLTKSAAVSASAESFAKLQPIFQLTKSLTDF
jgi:hypothetical protein